MQRLPVLSGARASGLKARAEDFRGEREFTCRYLQRRPSCVFTSNFEPAHRSTGSPNFEASQRLKYCKYLNQQATQHSYFSKTKPLLPDAHRVSRNHQEACGNTANLANFLQLGDRPQVSYVPATWHAHRAGRASCVLFVCPRNRFPSCMSNIASPRVCCAAETTDIRRVAAGLLEMVCRS